MGVGREESRLVVRCIDLVICVIHSASASRLSSRSQTGPCQSIHNFPPFFPPTPPFCSIHFWSKSACTINDDMNGLSKFLLLSACLPACLSVCLPACLPACLSVCLSVCLSPPSEVREVGVVGLKLMGLSLYRGLGGGRGVFWD